MQHLYYLLLALIPLWLHAQDWLPIRQGAAFYTCINCEPESYQTTVIADSIRPEAGGFKYYVAPRLEYNHIASLGRLSRTYFWNADSVFRYHTDPDKPRFLLYPTLTKLGDSWLADTSTLAYGYSIYGVLDSLYETEILGETDSVRRIRYYRIDKVTRDTLGLSEEISLSKKMGLVTFFDDFGQHLSLVGTTHPQRGEQMYLTLKQLFSMKPGDKLHRTYEYYTQSVSNGYYTHSRDIRSIETITEVYFSQFTPSVLVHFTQCEEDRSRYFSDVNGIDSRSETMNVTRNVAKEKTWTLPDDTLFHGRVYYFSEQIDSPNSYGEIWTVIIEKHPSLNRDQCTLLHGYANLRENTFSLSPGTNSPNYETYIAGAGGELNPQFYEVGGSQFNYTNAFETLVGIEQGGQVQGTLWNCNTLAADPSQLKVKAAWAPHPVAGTSRLLLPADLELRQPRLVIQDLQGRTLHSGTLLELSSEGMAAGLYLWQLWEGSSLLTTGKVAIAR